MTTITSTAMVPTDKASRYLQQLCKHWAHRFEVTFDPIQGTIDFGGSECRLEATGDVLELTVTGSMEEMDRLEGAVADHLQRFANKEGKLVVEWRRLN